MYCIFYRTSDALSHFKIEKRRECGQLKFSIDTKKWFDSLKDLVDFYKRNCITLTRSGVEYILAVLVPKEPFHVKHR